MKAAIFASVLIILMPKPTLGQQITSFNIKTIHVTKLNDGCRLLRATIVAPATGTSRDWAATATFIYRQLIKQNVFSDIVIDIRRDDIASRPTIESGLANLGASAATPECPNQVDHVNYFYVSERLLSNNELALRDIHARLEDIDPNTADEKTRQLFHLPRNWRLPIVGRQSTLLTEPATDHPANLRFYAESLEQALHRAIATQRP